MRICVFTNWQKNWRTRFGKSFIVGTLFLGHSRRQIVRSADSIGANIAEGTGRFNFQDNRRFVKTARGSLNETQHFLRRAFKRDLLTPADVKKIKPLVDNLAPQLNSYLKSIGRDHEGE